jgi:uncharacterized membrane protein
MSAIFWDCLVWVLFIFPILTGGVWIRQPGLTLELTEVSVPVVVLAALGFLLKKYKKTPLEQASSVRCMNWAWSFWKAQLWKHERLTLLAMTLGAGVLSSAVALKRHWAFGSGASDLGIFTNAIWNLTHGNGYISSVKDGMNLFADHQSPIFWLFAPVFYFFPVPETLLIAQAFGLATTGAILYFLGQQYLPRKHWGLAALPLLYWAYLPMRNANAFDFHPEVFILPLFLLAILGLQSERWSARRWGFLFLLLGLGAKESAATVLVGIGLAWIFGAGPLKTRLFTRSLGWCLIPFGFVIFYCETHFVPAFFGRTYVYQDNYQAFGSGLHSVILAPILQPSLFWSRIFGLQRLKFLFWTLAPLAFLPLLNPQAAVAALPGYLILFLSNGDHRVNLIYHYAAEPSVGLFWALPGAMLKASDFLLSSQMRFNVSSQIKLKTKTYASYWLLFWVFVSLGRSEIYRFRSFQQNSHTHWLRSELIPALTDVSMSVSGAIVPHVSTRRWVHHLPKLQMPDGKYVDCVIFDPLVNHWPLPWDQIPQWEARMPQLNYSKDYQCGQTLIYRLHSSSHSCLKWIPACEEKR